MTGLPQDTPQLDLSSVYQSSDLEDWWNNLDGTWRSVFESQMKFDGNYTAENLQNEVLPLEP